MTADISPLHDDLAFLAPLSDERAARLRGFVAGRAQGTVVDAGCGWAELLIQILEAEPALRGLGIDLDAEAIRHGKEIALRRGVGDRVTLLAGDVQDCLPREAGAVLCIGASQSFRPPAQAEMPIDYPGALSAMRDLLVPGTPAVYGEGIWVAEPTVEAVEALSGRPDEFTFLPNLLASARDSGFAVLRTHQASQDEWDTFESGFTAGYVRWLAGHPNEHPAAGGVSAALLAQNNAYFRGYRGILGMAYLELLAV